jgi:hypothetical protein
MPIDDELFERFQNRVHRLILDRRDLTLVLHDVDLLETEATEWFKDDDEELLRARRNLISVRITKVYELHGSVEQADRFLSQYEQMGFDDDHKRVAMTAIFARICVARKCPWIAKGRLTEALRGVAPGQYPQVVQLLGALGDGAAP